ncbi:MAG: segregation and condensation protein A [Actinomycetota bacterium]
MPYQVKLDVFEGPFDLLLHLISKREVDIYEISLAAITDDYLDHLQKMHELDLEIATEFLVVAASLIEIKASRLLPGPPRDDEDGLALSSPDLLIARLLEYRAFKTAAAHLSRLLEENRNFYPREAGPGSDFAHLGPDLMSRTSPTKLAALAVRVLSPKLKPELDVSHITPIRASVQQAAEAIRNLLESRSRRSFRELASNAESRIEVIVRFLALLELFKAGEVEVSQPATFGDIEVVWQGRSKAIFDEYEGSPSEPTGAGSSEGGQQ